MSVNKHEQSVAKTKIYEPKFQRVSPKSLPLVSSTIFISSIVSHHFSSSQSIITIFLQKIQFLICLVLLISYFSFSFLNPNFSTLLILGFPIFFHFSFFFLILILLLYYFFRVSFFLAVVSRSLEVLELLRFG